jgi:hypothetical protein
MPARLASPIGQTVHYVSYGTPAGEYKSECRAAIVTEVHTDPVPKIGLCVLNPTGMFFNREVEYHDGGETPGDPDCPNDHAAMPFRYCPEPGCGWQEASHKGGTWHYLEACRGQ